MGCCTGQLQRLHQVHLRERRQRHLKADLCYAQGPQSHRRQNGDGKERKLTLQTNANQTLMKAAILDL